VIPSSTARRYAEAAFDVAQEQGDAAAWLRELSHAVDALRGPEVSNFFKDPNVAREAKLEAVDRAFAGVRPQVRNLLRILAARERLHLVPSIVEEMSHLDREARGVLEASVTVARPITDAERQEIAQRVGAATGKKVELSARVDPRILGGVIIQIGDRLIDASVSGRLERLRQQLAF
jgi:F-type H+-transporting ATPase subunit delta